MNQDAPLSKDRPLTKMKTFRKLFDSDDEEVKIFVSPDARADRKVRLCFRPAHVLVHLLNLILQRAAVSSTVGSRQREG